MTRFLLLSTLLLTACGGGGTPDLPDQISAARAKGKRARKAKGKKARGAKVGKGRGKSKGKKSGKANAGCCCTRQDPALGFSCGTKMSHAKCTAFNKTSPISYFWNTKVRDCELVCCSEGAGIPSYHWWTRASCGGANGVVADAKCAGQKKP